MKVAIFVLAAVALALAEPPVPSSQYLPSSQYGAPSFGGRPSSAYGTPSFGQGGLGTPGVQYGAPRPSSQYGAPGAGGFGGAGKYSGGAGGYSGGGGGYGGGRYSGGYDDQSEPANYNFKYDVQDAASGNDFGHEEARQGDEARGKYYVLLPDGRRQVVEYTADLQGYKPRISYEQVGGGYAGGRGYAGAGGYQGGGYQGGAGGYQGAGAHQGGGGGYQGGAGGYQY